MNLIFEPNRKAAFSAARTEDVWTKMDEEYRGFKLYGGCDPVSETLLGRVTQWKPTGCIAHKHRNGVITELTRFQFPMTCDDEDVAKLFGLEIGRLLLDSSFRVFSDSPGMTAKSG